MSNMKICDKCKEKKCRDEHFNNRNMKDWEIQQMNYDALINDD